ncbi:hypothetical protein SAMN05216359_102223 [Roseateles sp. YR242]|uniref:hypothetical protein n=1 Tax=Roseateles sp. YR242 TaxID=1855305 RepID=UPI0008C66F79|nr:hypothetical protein [Roseateles sp. YR242]SEK56602.1 hypothetical protein SAMN05216359_102223 [Roseateles sp. YR242]
MTVPAHDTTHHTPALQGADPRRVYQRATGRSMARRFVCRPEPVWQRFHDVACAVGALAASQALLMQMLAPHWAWTVTGLVAMVLTIVIALRGRVLHGRVVRGRTVRGRTVRGRTVRGDNWAGAESGLLRWDTQQWWWQSSEPGLLDEATDATPAATAGAPLAVTPQVLLDLEHWMLLRLTPVGAGWRFWQHRLVALNGRHHAGDWSLLRIHLFMARG